MDLAYDRLIKRANDLHLCPIHYDKMHNPVIFYPCQHFACSECTKNFYYRHKEKYCPFCRRHIRKIVKFFHFEDQMEVFEQMKF